MSSQKPLKQILLCVGKTERGTSSRSRRCEIIVPPIETKSCRPCDERRRVRVVLGGGRGKKRADEPKSQILALCRFKALALFHVKAAWLWFSVQRGKTRGSMGKRDRGEGRGGAWKGGGGPMSGCSASGRGGLSHSCSSCFRPR